MSHLLDENGEEFFKTKDILNIQKRYYNNLYKETIQVNDTAIEDVIGDTVNKLNDAEAKALEGEITYEEIAKALNNMKNLKSPGNDGFNADFFLIFLVRFRCLYIKFCKLCIHEWFIISNTETRHHYMYT